MTIYVPNVGEREMLKSILNDQAVILGLYSNVVVPDGNTIIDTLTEMANGGGRGYAPIPLPNAIVEDAAAAGKWFVSSNATGKAQAQHGVTPQEWVFNAADVADGKTVYGVFGYTWVLPFDTGLAAGGLIYPGQQIIGGGGATGLVTAVVVESGSWAGGNAAGYFCIKTKTGTFNDNELIHVTGPTNVATVNLGALLDAIKKLLFVDAFSAGYVIDTVGQKITYLPILTLASA